MKKIIYILTIPLIISSCQKCKECVPADDMYVASYNISTTQIWNGTELEIIIDSVPIYAPTMYLEICRDNFDSKQKYKSYINYLENDLDYTCKSDFWN